MPDPTCDHQSPSWCHHLATCQNITVFVCINCEEGEARERCQKRYDDTLAAFQVEFPANC